MDKYFGIYCPYCRDHLSDTTGRLIYYPAREIAQAALDDARQSAHPQFSTEHLWVVEEFGQEKPIDIQSIPSGAPICPLATSALWLDLEEKRPANMARMTGTG